MIKSIRLSLAYLEGISFKLASSSPICIGVRLPRAGLIQRVCNGTVVQLSILGVIDRTHAALTNWLDNAIALLEHGIGKQASFLGVITGSLGLLQRSPAETAVSGLRLVRGSAVLAEERCRCTHGSYLRKAK